MIVFACPACHKPLSAPDGDAGQLRRCPACATPVSVPVAEGQFAAVAGPPPLPTSDRAAMDSLTAAVRAPVGIGGGFRSGGRRYGFNCAYCSSRLEATESMAAQDGQCPTCGNNITIPILDRHNRLIDPKTQQIIKQDPHPVHAYAAAGERAPKVVRHVDGHQSILCPRCSTMSPINANNCRTCKMPFTMEGTTVEALGATNGFCVASLVLGIIGLPTSFTVITPVLAVVFGGLGIRQLGMVSGDGRGRGMAVTGILLGLIGCAIAGYIWLH